MLAEAMHQRPDGSAAMTTGPADVCVEEQKSGGRGPRQHGPFSHHFRDGKGCPSALQCGKIVLLQATRVILLWCESVERLLAAI